MLKNANPAAIFNHDHDHEALEHAVAKIVSLGAQAGVSPDQMIVLLQSGLTIRELLDCVANHSAEIE